MRRLQLLTILSVVMVGTTERVVLAQPSDAAAASFASTNAPASDAGRTSPGVVNDGEPPLVGATAVAAGERFTCVVTASGGVQCWGSNGSGQLGDGTYLSRGTPAGVSGLTAGVVAVATGSNHTCAVTSGGGVKCWGNNSYGQLGDGTTTQRSTPVDVSGLTSGVVAVVAGNYHACALTSGGGVKCWGNNGSGQLGDGTITQRTAPVDVTGLTSGVVAVAGGNSHTCAVTSGGGVKCWGYNSSGQLGDGTTTQRSTPGDVSGLTSGVVAVAAGSSHTCAVTSGGGVKCWGQNSNSQVGDGTTTQRTAPVDVSGLASGVTAVAAGNYHTCAVTSGGGVKCWGYNYYGQLGDGTTAQRSSPIDVTGLAHAVSAVSAGYDHTCALATDGGVQCWGADAYGQLGLGGQPSRLSPADVVGLASGTLGVAAGYSHACVVTASGRVQCWGSNSGGQLGDGTTTQRSTPGDVSGLTSGVVAVAAGYYHTCAVTSGGVKCWGQNSQGQLGDGTTTQRTAPVDVGGLASGVVAVAAGYYHTCALTIAGGVKCWGYNSYGQLGDSTTTTRSTPGDVTGLTAGVVAVAAGSYHTCALTSAGGVKCWGYNYNGQLGDGTTTQRTTPVDVSGLTAGVVAVAGGNSHTCAVTSGGGVKCWGANYYGQLGDGTTAQRTAPVDVSGLTAGVMTVAGGNSHSCAVTSGGGVKCWGYNSTGQLGDGTTTTRSTPVDVTGLTAGVAAVAAGGSYTCARTTGGGVKCWGDNSSGQLGDGRVLQRLWPGNVSGFGATVVLTNLIRIYDGTPKAVTVTTTPPGLIVTVTYTGVGGTTYGPSTSAPSGVGTYAAFATVTDAGYSGSGSATATLTIANPAPAITSVTPASGPDSGGTPITITGTGFLPGATVQIDGMSAGGVYVNSTTITALTPSVSSERVATVVVRNPAPTVGEGTASFTYLAYPQITSLAPTWGPAGTSVTFTGVNFSPTDAAVTFGAQAAVVTSRSATQIVATVPAGLATGPINVTVSNVALGRSRTYVRLFTVAAAAPTGAGSVAAGGAFTCVVTAGGGVQCWGSNGSYELGDGTSVSRGSAADVTGLTSGVVSVAAGPSGSHACALTNGGAVKCWGQNSYGQLGDGTTTARATPVDVVGLAGSATAIAVSAGHTCALTTGGGVKCWGRNSYGQLGDGMTTNRSTPVDVTGLTSGVVAVAAGYYHTCAVTSAGAVQCWGYNNYGQLGDGTTASRATPANVSGLTSGAVAVATGYYYSCAVTTSGGVKCWGQNSSGQLGDGTMTNRTTPADVVGLTSDAVTAVAAGGAHACAVTTSGGVKCWGSNSSGQLGDGTTTQRTTAVEVNGLAHAALAVSAGSDHTCALTTDGGVQCWGSDVVGALGVGANIRSLVPADVAGLAGGTQKVATGGMHACVVTAAGGVQCWGSNSSGQLGDGTYVSRATPASVSALAGGVAKVAAGSYHSCALTSGGGVKCWGNNYNGQLGDGTTTTRSTPRDVTGLTTGVVAVGAGSSHTCALTSGGGVKCWGSNANGRLGDGTTTDRSTPVDVAGLTSGVVAVAAGNSHTCAVTSGGAVKCWGYNSSGQLGDGTTTQRTSPVDVTGLAGGVVAVAGGGNHTCALTSSGGVKCWGDNYDGQLGDGTMTQRLTPVDVTGLTSGVAAVAAGYFHTCALTSGSGVKCWGNNLYGQLGDGTTTSRTLAVDVSGLTSGAVAVAASNWFFASTCALTTGGGVKCWGDNFYGQLGDGRALFRPWPTNALGFGATVVLTNLTRIYDGTPKAVTVTTAPPGLIVTVTYTGIGATTYGPSTSAPSGLGTYTAFATVTDPGYSGSGSATETLTIANPAPAITSVTPASGPESGGTPITITGTGFLPGATVQIDGMPAGGVYVNSTTITALTPSVSSARVATVVVRNPAPTVGDGTASFTYLAYPQITSLAPTWGPAGTSVTFTGVNFSPTDAAVTFGAQAAVVTSRSATQIVATVPAGLTAGPVDVTVSNVALGRSRTYVRLFTVAAAAPTGAGSVAAGNQFTCVVTASGGVQCWGQNGNGQLGDGTYLSRGTPADVSGLTSGVVAVVAGNYHACALTSGGGVKCWGQNGSGQLGDGTITQRTAPVDVTGLTSGVVAVAGGYSHTCAVTSGGGVKCWGYNYYGQLGDGTTTQRSTPVDVSGLTSGVVALTTGSSHTCAVTNGGGVQCWGYNGSGQLGDGTITQRTAPVDVSGLTSGVVAVAAGYSHTCAVTSGGVKCWGQNSRGQLGDGTTTQRTAPVDVSGLASGVTAIAAGYSHACAVTSGGGVKCWGYNYSGQLGDGTTAQRSSPVDVTGLAHAVSAVSAGYDHTCALTTDGGVQCWGSDAYGQLGLGGQPSRLSAADVSGLTSGTVALAVGLWHACVVTAGGGVQCWGSNSSGQLGDGTTVSRATPASVTALAGGVAKVAAGSEHTCALTIGGGVKCWGYNSYGQLGDGTTTQRSTPGDVTGLTSGVVAVAAGNTHTCAVTSGGGVKCWGSNGNGQLGDGTTTTRSTPGDVTGLTSGVAAIAAGYSYTCALTSAGGVKCWGYNAYGQLGDGTTTQRTTPGDVTGLTTGVVAVAAGTYHTCAVTSGGGVKCWGNNGNGQLGDGTTTQRSTAVDVSGLTAGVMTVAAGNSHACAVTSGGGVKCWGYNSTGQLGDGTATSRSTPVDVAGLSSGVAAVAAGGYYTCARTTGGGVKCWGDNSSGQLGDGRTLQRLWPGNVSGFGATVVLTNLSRIYDGSPKPVTATTVPPGLVVTLTYTGAGTTIYGPSATPPTNGGTYAVLGLVVDASYSGSVTETLIIYNLVPTITSITPAVGPDFGGTPVTITGTNICPGASVWVNGLAAGGVFVNSTTITAVTPSSTDGGLVPVVVRNASPALEGEGSSTFTYLAYPQVASLTPSYGLAGTVVTITGRNFSDTDVAVSFGGMAGVVSSRSTTGITVTVPAGLSPGAVAVTVANIALGRSRTYPGLFTVGALPSAVPAAMAVGSNHVCAVTSGGRVQCWGYNSSGQLGDGTTLPRSTPADVSGLGSGVTALAAGSSHTCALTSGGGVKCWGYNYYGQLGDGTTTQRTEPVDVIGLATGVTAIAAGSSHTCAVTSSGAVKCWGYNAYGQLGDGTTTNRTGPADVTGLTSGITALAAGSSHTCAVTSGGGMKCWGYNYYGQLGDGTTTDRSTPTDVSGLTAGVVTVATGYYHTCAVTSGGGVKCWGYNYYGQLGDGTTTQRTAPVDVTGLASGVVALVAGIYHACALTSGGGVQCWGYNSYGQLGDGSTTNRSVPGDVIGLTSGVLAVASGPGAYVTCAVTGVGVLQCWGYNLYGQLGDGTAIVRTVPVDVSGMASGVATLTAGYSHTCAVRSGGGVQCWGYNYYGGLGDGTTLPRSTPADVTGLGSGATTVGAGLYHSCAVTTGGGVKCWGYNYYGQLGDGTTADRSTPGDVTGLPTGVVAVAAGYYHTCALTSAGGVKCWGYNSNGQLGDGTTTSRSTPGDVTGLTAGVTAIAAGYSHTCALTSAGGVKCWGQNSNSQLGDGTTTQRTTPVDVSGLTAGVVTVAAGTYHTCAVTSGGGVKCWGYNYYGQLGDGTATNRSTPVDVVGLASGMTALAAGTYHSCAVTSGGGVKCWGQNSNGQLGDGTTTNRSAPVNGVGLTAGVVALAAGSSHTCALTSSGGVKCWGADFYGQLGVGRLVFRTEPGAVVAFGKVAATVTLTDLTRTYDGTPKAATVTTTPTGLSVTITYMGTGGTAYGPSAAPPTQVGIYAVSAIVTDATYYGSAAGTLTVFPPAPTFTDDPLTARTTGVKAVHLTELRSAINTLRVLYGLAAAIWTDATLTPGVTVVKAVHVTDLRTALAEAYTAASRTPPTYTHAAVTGGITVITSVDIAELRAALLAIW